MFQLLDDQLDELIRKNWETMDDYAIGRLIDPHVQGYVVAGRRYSLELYKRPPSRRSIARTINRDEFERRLLLEGYTMTDLAKEHHCTKTRLTQVANELGVKHSPECRAPEWYVARKARFTTKLPWVGQPTDSVHRIAA